MAELRTRVLIVLSSFCLSGAMENCQQHLTISSPKQMEGLSGSCLQIPCTFTPDGEFPHPETSCGIWMKSKTNIQNTIFNSCQKSDMNLMNITGNLSERNCTTLVSTLNQTYSGVYFFRIQSTGFRANAGCDPLRITVEDSPPRPILDLGVERQEGESLNLTCRAATPCPHLPPELTWNLQEKKTRTVENTDHTVTTTLQTSITLSDKHDGYSISCSARYPVNNGKDVSAETNTILTVSYAPKDTSAWVRPAALVAAGTWVNLSCSSRANPPVSSFSWFHRSSDGPVKVSDGDVYSFNLTDGGIYFCEATNGLGKQRSSDILLNVSEHPDGLSGSILGAVIGGIAFTCLLVLVGALVWSRRSKLNPAGEPAAANEEEIHYGQIDFSQQRTPAQTNPRPQEPEYAEVKRHQERHFIYSDV